MLALGEDQRSEHLAAALDDEEIKEISQAMAGLGTVACERGGGSSWWSSFPAWASTGAIMGSFEGTQRLLASILPGRQSRRN